MKLQLTVLASQANEHAQQHRTRHREMIDGLRGIFQEYPELKEKVNKLDANFLRKLQWYPEDITFHRVAKLLPKLMEA